MKPNIKELADFLKESVNTLITTKYTCCEYKLDKDLSVFVGWTDGYDPDDEGYIHAKEEPTFVVAAKIASNHEYLKTDLDWLVQPYYESDGEVWDTEITLTESSNFEEDADWFLKNYENIRVALDKGELLLESKNLDKNYSWKLETSRDLNSEELSTFIEKIKKGYHYIEDNSGIVLARLVVYEDNKRTDFYIDGSYLNNIANKIEAGETEGTLADNVITESYRKIDESKRYEIYLTCGEDGVYNSSLVDVVDDENQAIDRVNELQAETGCGAYYKEILHEAVDSNDNVELYEHIDANSYDIDEVKANKMVKIMAYGKIYYEFTEEEWKNMPDDEKESIILDTSDQASEEEGFIVECDEVEIKYQDIDELEEKKLKKEDVSNWNDLNEGLKLKIEAKFKDKVKAIKRSLKKNDKRLSDDTAQKSAERIAGSMIKKEEFKSQGDIIKYNGYIAEIDEPNIDNFDETIVTIYKSEEDYKNGDYLENISLKNDNLEQYIKEYIDETYTLNEAKFKDKVKAIKESLKKNDKRLSAEDELEVLANDIIDFMGADMGTWFDEIQDNEEEIFYDTLSILEGGDKNQIQILIDNIAEAEIDEETAKEVGIKSSNNLIERISKVITDKKEESLENGWKPSIDLYTRQINEIADNLGISKNEVQKEGDSIKFRYNGKVYFAEPVAMYQVNIFDDNHNQISWGVLTDRIKEEVFTDYITDKKFIYQLVGGEYAGEYTKEGLDKLNLINGNTGENLGSRKELRNQPTLKGYLGPMWNGVKDGNVVIRYETQEVYNMLSESNKIEEIASKVPGTEVEKKPVIEYEELYSGADIDNLGSDAELIYDMYEKLGIDIDEAWDDIVANDMDSGVLKIAHINGNSYFVYDDGETQAYCIGRASDNMPISVIGNIEDDTEIMKPIKRTVHESKKLQEDEIIDRPEDILEAEEDVESKSTEDVIVNKEESETVLDLLQDRIGQQIEVGRLNAILQSVFGMYNKTFILPTDLYNMDLDETQEVYDMLSESEKLNENKTEDYWDAKELARDGFIALLKFNFGIDKDGNNYMITKDAYDIRRFHANTDKEAIEFYNKWKNAERNAFGDYILDENESLNNDESEFMFDKYNIRKSLAGYIKYVADCINDKELDRLPVSFDEFYNNEFMEGYYTTEDTEFLDTYSIDELYDMATEYDEYIIMCEETGENIKTFNEFFSIEENKLLQEDEIIDRPEDLVNNEKLDTNDNEDVITNEENTSKSVIDSLSDRIGQQLEAGRLNAILQNVFGMFNKTFILPSDLYNMNLNETQELTVFDDGDEYTIYFDIIDIDNGIIEITGVDLL